MFVNIEGPTVPSRALVGPSAPLAWSLQTSDNMEDFMATDKNMPADILLMVKVKALGDPICIHIYIYTHTIVPWFPKFWYTMSCRTFIINSMSGRSSQLVARKHRERSARIRTKNAQEAPDVMTTSIRPFLEPVFCCEFHYNKSLLPVGIGIAALIVENSHIDELRATVNVPGISNKHGSYKHAIFIQFLKNTLSSTSVCPCCP